jgi:KDO2-lipid IV(A) lauroyltransferase
LPRRLGLAITSAIAVFFRWSHPSVVRIVHRNLAGIETALGRPFDPLLVPEVFHHFARSVYEFVSLPHRSNEELLARFQVVRGEEHLERREGEGMLVLSAHLAGWEMGGAWLATRLGGFHTVALDHPSARVTEYFTRRRARRGIQVHPLGSSYRNLKEALGRGEVVALLTDRTFGRGGRTVAFFGRPARFPTGYLHLAAETGARVVPLFARRVGNRTEVRVESPFTVSPGSEGEALGRVVRLLESHVARAPEQWARFTPIWEDEGD